MLRQKDRLVHLGHTSHTDGTSRSHNDLEFLWKEATKPELGDGLLVRTAHVHDLDGTLWDLCNELLEAPNNCTGQLRLPKGQGIRALDFPPHDANLKVRGDSL